MGYSCARAPSIWPLLAPLRAKNKAKWGTSFPEKVYENAMAVELRSRKIAFRTQAPLKVKYRGEPVGEYFADMIVENSVICEFKALETAPKEAEI